jgi:hypothetical protein
MTVLHALLDLPLQVTKSAFVARLVGAFDRGLPVHDGGSAGSAPKPPAPIVEAVQATARDQDAAG